MTAAVQADATAPSGLPLALTMGDPAGIGLEIAIKAWQSRQSAAVPAFVLYGDPAALAARAEALSLTVALQEVACVEDGAAIFDDALPIRPLPASVRARAGHPNANDCAAVLASITTAVGDVIAGKAAALVTNPISKSVLYKTGFAYPGHTEYLAALAVELGKQPPDLPPPSPVMMLVGGGLRVVPVTIHIPLRDVSRHLTPQGLERTLRSVAGALIRDFAIPNPRLAVAGLNPHAGESGTLGDEEERMIQPVIEKLQDEGLCIAGPYPADTMFHAAARATYDAAVCMYHDQALIPLKTLAFESGVNVTLGLPFVRTSPDHGTAFDVAGKGIASPESLIESLKLARKIAINRASHVNSEIAT